MTTKSAERRTGSHSTRRSPRPSRTEWGLLRRDLLKRDGNECFYCGKRMKNGDTTLEHLVARSCGGGNSLANLVLAHKDCNAVADALPLIEKILLRESCRGSEQRPEPD